MFFSLEPEQALLSDINAELIELYEVVRDDPGELRCILEWHQAMHSPAHYYAIREQQYADKKWRAGRTLYLNRTCWNGLYRLNRKGEFNVPIGTKTAILLEESFSDASAVLERASLKCQDFEPTIDDASEGDFLFVDPPYTVKHNMNGFLKYNENIFRWSDQVRLRDACVRAANRGASVVVTNANHESVRDLYAGKAVYRAIARQSVLAADSNHRGSTTEALFTLNSER